MANYSDRILNAPISNRSSARTSSTETSSNTGFSIANVHLNDARPAWHPTHNINQPQTSYVVDAIIRQDGSLYGPVMFGFINEKNDIQDPILPPLAQREDSGFVDVTQLTPSQINELSLASIHQIYLRDPEGLVHLNVDQMVAFIEKVNAYVGYCERTNRAWSQPLLELYDFIHDIIKSNLPLSAQSLLEAYAANQSFDTTAASDGLKALRQVMRAIRITQPKPTAIDLVTEPSSQIALMGSTDLYVLNPAQVEELDHNQLLALSFALRETALSLRKYAGQYPAVERKIALLLSAVRERVLGVMQYVHNTSISSEIDRAKALISQADRFLHGQDQAVICPLALPAMATATVEPSAFSSVSFAQLSEVDIQSLKLDAVLCMNDEDQFIWFSSLDADAILNCTDSNKIFYWLQALKYLHHHSKSAEKLHIAIENQISLLRHSWIRAMKVLNPNFSHIAPKFEAYIDSILAVAKARQQIGIHNLISLSRLPSSQLDRLSIEQLLNVDIREFEGLNANRVLQFARVAWKAINANLPNLVNVQSNEFRLYRKLCWLYQVWVLKHYPSSQQIHPSEALSAATLETVLSHCASAMHRFYYWYNQSSLDHLQNNFRQTIRLLQPENITYLPQRTLLLPARASIITTAHYPQPQVAPSAPQIQPQVEAQPDQIEEIPPLPSIPSEPEPPTPAQPRAIKKVTAPIKVDDKITLGNRIGTRFIRGIIFQDPTNSNYVFEVMPTLGKKKDAKNDYAREKQEFIAFYGTAPSQSYYYPVTGNQNPAIQKLAKICKSDNEGDIGAIFVEGLMISRLKKISGSAAFPVKKPTFPKPSTPETPSAPKLTGMEQLTQAIMAFEQATFSDYKLFSNLTEKEVKALPPAQLTNIKLNKRIETEADSKLILTILKILKGYTENTSRASWDEIEQVQELIWRIRYKTQHEDWIKPTAPKYGVLQNTLNALETIANTKFNQIRGEFTKTPFSREQIMSQTVEEILQLSPHEALRRAAAFRHMGILNTKAEKDKALAFVKRLSEIYQAPSSDLTQRAHSSIQALRERFVKNYVVFNMMIDRDDDFAQNMHRELVILKLSLEKNSA